VVGRAVLERVTDPESVRVTLRVRDCVATPVVALGDRERVSG
jgi:hypothetical protein